MRIAYVITRADAVGGASVHVRDLARAMLDRGHDVLVLIGGSGPVTDQLAAARVPFRSLRFLRRAPQPLADARAYRELLAALRDFRPSLVSTHTAKAGWLGRAASARLRIPVLYTPHGWPIGERFSPAGRFLFRPLERHAARWADAIVCVSESERNLALSARIAPPEKLHVIHNGVRDVPLRAQPDAAPPRIVSLARLEPPKDPFTLLHALASLRSLDWQLDFIGGGPLEPETRALADRLGIASRIQWLGYQPDPAPLLARAQVFALSSRSEGFPRSVLEAMRAGLPVVASSVGGVPEAVSDGSTGFLVPPGDPAAFARALDAVLRDPAKRKLMGARGRQSYQARFLFDSMLQSTAGLYDRLVRTA